MATIAAVVRWADNTAQFVTNLEQGLDQIEATTRGASKMVDAFDGNRVILQANNMVAALDQIKGGVAGLTENEQARYNAKLTEAIEKFEALGKTAPAAMVAVRNATADVQGPFDRLNTLAESFGLNLQILTIAGAVAGITELGKAAIASASNIESLSVRTGISTDELQRLQYAGVQVGLGIDQIAQGVSRFQKNLVEDGGKAAGALQTLGLDAQALISMSPGDAFELMAEKLSLIQNPAQRTAIAIELLGKSGAELLPLLTAHIKDLESGATVMSAETIKNLHTLEAAWEATKTNVGASVGQAISDLTSWRDFTHDGIAQIVGGVLGPGAEAWIKYWEAAKPPASAAPAWGALQTTSGPAVGNQSGPSNDVMAAYINLFSHQKEASAYQEQLAADAKKTAAAIQSIADNLSGKDITQKISETAAGVTSLGGASGVFASQLPALVKQLNDWYEAGYKLPPVLEQILMNHLDLVDVLPKVTTNSLAFIKTLPDMTAAVKDEMKAESEWLGEMASLDAKISQAPFNIQKFLKENSIKIDPKTLGDFLNVKDFGDYFSDQFGKTLKDDLPRDLEQAFASGSLTSLISTTGSQIGLDLSKAISSSMGGGTLGGFFGGIFGGIFGSIGGIIKSDQLTASLKQQIEQLGGVPSMINANGNFGGNDALQQQLQTLQATHDQATALSDQANKLTTLAEAQSEYNSLMITGTASASMITAAWKAVNDAQVAAGQTATALTDNPLYRQSAAFADSIFGFTDPSVLRQNVQDAQDAYKAMLSTGTFTADQLIEAWQKVQTAQNAANGLDQFGVSSSFSNVQSLVSKYGLSASDGNQVYKQNLALEQGGQLGQDYATLTQGGLWGTSVANSMHDQIQSIVSLGVSLPASLKEAVGALIGEGTLTDASGNTLTSLNQLTFQADPTSQFDDLTKSTGLAATSATNLANALNGQGPYTLAGALFALQQQATDFYATIQGSAASTSAPSLTRVPVLDTPLMRVQSAGLALLNPGDLAGGGLAGMPAKTRFPIGSSAGGGGDTYIVYQTNQTIDGENWERFISNPRNRTIALKALSKDVKTHMLVR